VGLGGLFQSAGLTVTIDGWQYVRFERNVQEDWGRKHKLYFEHGENGNTRAISLKKSTWNPKEPLWLRLVRRGKTLSVSAKTMEGDWQPAGELELPQWPSKIWAGVHATNTTSNPFTASLEGFEVTLP
jgi:regulation of enolase protein 1 (concanavalin A-like superfamily)